MDIITNITKFEKVYSGDPLALDLLGDLILKSSKYVSLVNKMDVFARVGKYKCSNEQEMKDKVQIMDIMRRRTHNVVISTIKACNRLLRSDGHEFLIYDGDENDRYQIGDYAGNLTKAIFDIRER